MKRKLERGVGRREEAKENQKNEGNIYTRGEN